MDAIPNRKLQKFRAGHLTLQYRMMRRFADYGEITSRLLNLAGEQSWAIQRSAGQRIRDCRKFGLHVICEPDPNDESGSIWRVSREDQELARQIVAEADAREGADANDDV